jgi:hypothetical protein
MLNESRCASKVIGLEQAAWEISKNVNSTGVEAMRQMRENVMDPVRDRCISHSWTKQKCKPVYYIEDKNSFEYETTCYTPFIRDESDIIFSCNLHTS